MSRLVEESVLVYKAALSSKGRPVLVTLRLPKGTRINRNLTNKNKNRADKAVVVKINRVNCYHSKWKPIYTTRKDSVNVAYSIYSSEFEYKVGLTIKPIALFSKTTEECASGIHFFSTKKAALNYCRYI